MFVDFFFFQAEDGIRDRDVTGVQTCALPISKFERGIYLWKELSAPSSKDRFLFRILRKRKRGQREPQSDGESAVSVGASRGARFPRPGGRRGAIRWLASLTSVPPCDLCALEEDAHGQRGWGPGSASRRHHSRSLETKPLGEVYQERHRASLRERLEAAVFQEGGR